MNSLIPFRRSVSGSIVSVTNRHEAAIMAAEKLCRDPQKLIAELERDIHSQVGRMCVCARGGDYTPEVVAQVSDLYRSQGWAVHFDGYWLNLD